MVRAIKRNWLGDRDSNPDLLVPETSVLPLDHPPVRVRSVVPRTGFEPVTSALRGRCPEPLDERGTYNDNQ